MRAVNDMIENMMPKSEKEAKHVFVWLAVGVIVFLLAVRFCA